MSSIKNSGLNDRARQIVERTIPVRVERTLHFPCGGAKVVESTEMLPAFDKVARESILVSEQLVILYRYQGQGGVFYDEYVQSQQPGCDEIYLFLALKTADGTPVPESLREEWEMAVDSACYCRHTC
ncbi:MAG: hypothetical protein K2W95_20535 [Candidatus Obscuribacterales bacterium]|nr:hypothetical protein [Candidatus Obscuribacterales bacterium]